MKELIIYISCIVLLNFGFDHVPLIDLGFGLFSPMAILAGAVFVARDFAQRAVGHWVLAGMILGCVISYLMANPFVAIASVVSFAVSELVDWGVYTKTKKSFYDRVMISSLISTPVDTIIFLSFISQLTPATFVLMVLAKLLTSIGIYYYGKRRLAQEA